MTIEKLYAAEEKLLNILRLASDEKAKDKARRQIEILNENMKMLESETV